MRQVELYKYIFGVIIESVGHSEPIGQGQIHINKNERRKKIG